MRYLGPVCLSEEKKGEERMKRGRGLFLLPATNVCFGKFGRRKGSLLSLPHGIVVWFAYGTRNEREIVSTIVRLPTCNKFSLLVAAAAGARCSAVAAACSAAAHCFFCYSLLAACFCCCCYCCSAAEAAASSTVASKNMHIYSLSS